MASVATPNKAGTTLIARGTSNGAGAVTRSAAQAVGLGGRVTARVSNGNPAPTTAGVLNVYAATPDGNGDGTPPTIGANNAAIGADWFLIGTLYGATVVNNDIRDPLPLYVGGEYKWICVECAGNAGSAAAFEAHWSGIASIAST